ncbi:MAG: hypothetical protein HPAVJP_0800 [Candidatus Hepatoplasma vulgare]|nr:MAG: hypothetical protein HPAVJP_0800 [Candidatus Hepatoplasma sp.]
MLNNIEKTQARITSLNWLSLLYDPLKVISIEESKIRWKIIKINEITNALRFLFSLNKLSFSKNIYVYVKNKVNHIFKSNKTYIHLSLIRIKLSSLFLSAKVASVFILK